MPVQNCPCGSLLLYANCCGRFIEQEQTPATPEELMRSRYTAYTQANMEYIVATMKSPAADHFEIEPARDWAKRSEWLKLEIVQTKLQNEQGWVEFIAQFNLEKKPHTLHELSEFHRENGRWYYTNGHTPTARQPIRVQHIGRNEPCTCGSGKKYKKCCGVT